MLKCYEINNFDISTNDFIRELDAAEDKGKFFFDIDRSVEKAVLLWYANAGYLRFDEYKEYQKRYDNADVDVEKIRREIEEEALSDDELDILIRRFHECHSFSHGKLLSCGVCGIRETEKPNFL